MAKKKEVKGRVIVKKKKSNYTFYCFLFTLIVIITGMILYFSEEIEIVITYMFPGPIK